MALGLLLVGFDYDHPIVVQSIGSGTELVMKGACGALGGVLTGVDVLRRWFRCSIPWRRSQYSAASLVYSLKVPSLGAVTSASWSFG